VAASFDAATVPSAIRYGAALHRPWHMAEAGRLDSLPAWPVSPEYRAPRAPGRFPRPAKSRELRLPGATDSVRWAWQATAPTHGTWLAPRAPDSTAFFFVPLRYAPVGTAPSRSHTAPPSNQ